MPRQIDHQHRRRVIADAVCQLIGEHGLEAVSLRDVAARAEVSLGAVQRCFRTKAEMLTFALRDIGDQVIERTRQRAAGSADPLTTFTHLLTETALVDPAQRAQARVWLAFTAQAAVDPTLAAELRTGYATVHQLLTGLIRDCQRAGELREVPDPAALAWELLALTDGLTAQTLVGLVSPEAARGLLDRRLRRLWPLPPSRPRHNHDTG